MSPYEVTVREVGSIALRLLNKPQAAHLLGATSRGFFVSMPTSWVVFISTESFRGPLTLNLDGHGSDFSHLIAGQPVAIYPGRLSLPRPGLVIDTSQALCWQAPEPSQENLLPEERKNRVIQVARYALAAGKRGDFSTLLPLLLEFDGGSAFQESPVLPLLQRIRQTLAKKNVPTIIAALEPFLGRGMGLTPGGDDLVMGFLLALKRWGHILAPNLEVESIAEGILPLAYRKTTTLSANLIECAAQGQANERLILALDGMMTGKPDAITCASYLSEWGNTSGLEALVGVVLAGS